ncbi:hypothetical protein P43SY_005267 [Pythium insidiosum]|uniref:Uncharacterized protein n=1 Tax=Pythium insidiosum TaxID=114742 RepID=A0AAD5Q5T1_PYTIN|nr:hypothetical protein P43SY_005267 [Pythium insidiosum]
MSSPNEPSTRPSLLSGTSFRLPRMRRLSEQAAVRKREVVDDNVRLDAVLALCCCGMRRRKKYVATRPQDDSGVSSATIPPPETRLSVGQGLQLVQRIAVLLAALVYIAVSLRASLATLKILQQRPLPPIPMQPDETMLMRHWVGGATVRDSPLVTSALDQVVAPLDGTVYLQSQDTFSFLGCANVPQFDRVLYGNAYLRSVFQTLVRDAAYNLTFLNEIELIAPVVDCSFGPLLTGDQHVLRAFFLVRQIAQPERMSLLPFSYSMQDYSIPKQNQHGPAGLGTIGVIEDMRVQSVAQHIVFSQGYPFAGLKFQVYSYVGESAGHEWIIQSIPANLVLESPKVVVTSSKVGFYIGTTTEQSNMMSRRWEVDRTDPVAAISKWRWDGGPVVFDSWGWVHYVHLLFAADTVIGLIVLFVIIARKLRQGYVWIGDAFMSISTSLFRRGRLEDLAALRSTLTGFEIATGAALQQRLGVVCDYDNCIYIKGVKYASADGIYCSGYVILGGKWLLATRDLLPLILMKLLRFRFKNIYVYIATSVQTTVASLKVLRGMRNPPMRFEAYETTNILGFVGNGLLRDSPLVMGPLQNDTTPRRFTVYLESNGVFSFTKCSTPKFDAWVNGNSLLRLAMLTLIRDASMQDFKIPQQNERGPMGFGHHQYIKDMREPKVYKSHFSGAPGYPFEPAMSHVFEPLGINDEGCTVGYVVQERIDPAFAVVVFEIFFAQRLAIIKWFPSVLKTVKDYARMDQQLGRTLTLFEIATGAELQSRFGIVADYDNCIIIKGMKYASADGIFCNGFVIARGKYLVATSDILAIIVLKLTRVRLKNVFIFEVTGNSVQQTARLVYPDTLSWSDLTHLNITILS